MSRAPWWWLLMLAVSGLFSLVLFWEPLRRLLPFTTFPLGFDSFAILAAIDANRLGLDVSQDNPLDVLGRSHVYSSWWFYLKYLGLGRSNLTGFYLTSLAGFLLPVFLRFRPRNSREFFWLFSYFASLPVMLCLHRGNNDLIVFGLLVFVVPCLLSESPVTRLLAPLLIVFAAGLKYYPLIALVLLFVPEQPKVRSRLFIFAGLLFCLLVLGFVHDFTLGTHITVVSDARGFLGVGSSLLFSGQGFPSLLHKLLGLGLGLLVVLLSWWLRGAGGWTPSVARERSYVWFLLGASLYAGSYWLIANWAYRLIFMFWLIPFLCEVPCRALMPRWLLVSTLWIQKLFLVLLWVPLLFGCSLGLWDIPLGSVYGQCVIWLLQLGYCLLAIYCTALVADLVFTRLRSWKDQPAAV